MESGSVNREPVENIREKFSIRTATSILSIEDDLCREACRLWKPRARDKRRADHSLTARPPTGASRCRFPPAGRRATLAPAVDTGASLPPLSGHAKDRR
jgi:hypothetical protein